MKIAITSSGQSMNDLLDPRFGRCSYFLLYDSETKTMKAVENKGQLSGGGAGIAAAQQIIDEGVQVVITGNMGPNAFDLMETSEIKVYRSNSVPCQECVKLFLDGKLELIATSGPSHMGMGRQGRD
jgi:predicted Fe-Mo cluster-binding NifX family protein